MLCDDALERHRTGYFDSCFNGRLMLRQLTDLNFKMITFLLVARFLKRVLYPPTEEHTGHSQASQMEPFERIENVFKLTLITIFSKNFRNICRA